MKNVIQLRTQCASRDAAVEELDVTIEGYQPHIPDSEYIATFIAHKTVNYRGQLRVILSFSILHPEEFAGIELYRFYNVKDRNGKPVAAAGSNLAREYRRLCGGGHRLDRLSYRQLKDKRIRVRTCTVDTDWKGNLLEECSQYSKIDELLGIDEPDNWVEEYNSATEDR